MHYYDRPRRGMPVSKRKRRLIWRGYGGGLVTRISNKDGPQLPVVGEDLPCLAAREVVASRVEAVRALEFIDQRNTVVGSRSRFPCSDSDDSDVLLVGMYGL